MQNQNFSNFPELTTDRCTLRQLKDSDVENIFIMRSDEEILKYLDMPKAQSLDDAEAFITKVNNLIKNNESIYWVIDLKDTAKCIGTICLWNFNAEKTAADIGFVLLNEFQGKGIMREVVPVVLNYGFNKLRLDTIEGEVDPKNEKSIRLMTSFNFTLKQKFEKTDIYSLTQTKWTQNAGN